MKIMKIVGKAFEAWQSCIGQLQHQTSSNRLLAALVNKSKRTNSASKSNRWNKVTVLVPKAVLSQNRDSTAQCHLPACIPAGLAVAHLVSNDWSRKHYFLDLAVAHRSMIGHKSIVS